MLGYEFPWLQLAKTLKQDYSQSADCKGSISSRWKKYMWSSGTWKNTVESFFSIILLRQTGFSWSYRLLFNSVATPESFKPQWWGLQLASAYLMVSSGVGSSAEPLLLSLLVHLSVEHHEWGRNLHTSIFFQLSAGCPDFVLYFCKYLRKWPL